MILSGLFGNDRKRGRLGLKGGIQTQPVNKPVVGSKPDAGTGTGGVSNPGEVYQPPASAANPYADMADWFNQYLEYMRNERQSELARQEQEARDRLKRKLFGMRGRRSTLYAGGGILGQAPTYRAQLLGGGG